MPAHGQTLGLLAALVLGGCAFASGSPAPTGTGGAGGTGTGQGGSGTGGTGSGGVGTGGAGAGGATGLGGANVSGAGGVPGSGGDVGLGTGGMPQNCGQTNVSVMPLPPDILIVQDRSLSMTDNSDGQPCTGGTVQGNGNCGATSKWAQVTAAITQALGQTQATVNWGLMFLGDEATVCGAATAPVVDVGPGSASLISTAFSSVQFTGQVGTPTTAVLDNAVQYLQGLTDPNPKYLLLATDGEPNCAGGSASAGATDALGAEGAVSAALAAGFPTFVVGIATTSDAAANAALNVMAMDGGEAQTGAATQYYAVTDTAGLVSVLQKIIGLTASCTIPLTGVNGTLDKVAVSAKDAAGNTIEIMQDATNGWSYTDASMTAIVLNGDACNNLQSVTYTDFQFIYTCATGMICIDNCPPSKT
jgi:hypothetical protein